MGRKKIVEILAQTAVESLPIETTVGVVEICSRCHGEGFEMEVRTVGSPWRSSIQRVPKTEIVKDKDGNKSKQNVFCADCSGKGVVKKIQQ